MEISIINEQRRIRLNKKRLESLARDILRILKVPSGSSLGITFVDKSKMRKLNKRYLGKNRLTDVIAFGYQEDLCRDYLGDLVICPAAALDNSRIYKNSFLNELALYIIHGILHLLGYDDIRRLQRVKMRKKEKEVMKKLC